MKLVTRCRSLTLAAVSIALATGCGASATGPGSSAPPGSPIRPATRALVTVPAPCALMDPATLRTLGLSAGGKQPQSPVHEGAVREESCAWGSPSGTSGGLRSLTLIVDVFAATGGQSAAVAAQGHFQQNAADQAQADNDRGRPVPGMASQAVISHISRGGLTESHLLTRDQNVLIAAAYGGATSAGAPLSTSAADNGALTAARQALSALATP